MRWAVRLLDWALGPRCANCNKRARSFRGTLSADGWCLDCVFMRELGRAAAAADYAFRMFQHTRERRRVDTDAERYGVN